MTTVQFRIDEETKNAVKQILDKLGLDMSSALKMYLNQIIITKGIPFRPSIENLELIERIKAGKEELYSGDIYELAEKYGD
jgi:addiction module RelB/DinJ family antitoxin